MLTVRYGDAFQARSAAMDGALQVSNPSPLVHMAVEPDGYTTGVAGSATAGTARVAKMTAAAPTTIPAR
jgi:hypothetical protein